ncbi:transposase, partial [bacterium]|nr:transposase [bacterium]
MGSSANRRRTGQQGNGSNFSSDRSANFQAVSSANEDLSSQGEVQRNSLSPLQENHSFRKRAPNQMWHVDFAGPFQLTEQKVYLLVVVDDYSRFALAIELIPSRETTPVTSILARLFGQYGTPKEILTDHGTTFASLWTTSTHQFSEFCSLHSVNHKLAAPYYPESNGKVEALIKTGKRECLNNLLLSSLGIAQLQQELEQFREYYNFHRLH